MGLLTWNKDFCVIVLNIAKKIPVSKLIITENREKPASQPAETVAVPQTNGSLGGELDDETIQRNRAKLFGRKKTTPKSPWVLGFLNS